MLPKFYDEEPLLNSEIKILLNRYQETLGIPHNYYVLISTSWNWVLLSGKRELAVATELFSLCNGYISWFRNIVSQVVQILGKCLFSQSAKLWKVTEKIPISFKIARLSDKLKQGNLILVLLYDNHHSLLSERSIGYFCRTTLGMFDSCLSFFFNKNW